MREKQLTEKGLADLAYRAEADHEVQMARAQLYKIGKYAIKLHEMLKGVSEAEGLEGWVQSKITKAADYMGAVYHHMDYENAFEAVKESKIQESKMPTKAHVMKMCKDGKSESEMLKMHPDADKDKLKDLIKKCKEELKESKDEADVDESGIMYKAGVKKYGKDGMKKIQSAAGKGASAEEIGAIKDKHNKKKKESVDPYKESLAAKLESKKKTFELDKKTIKQAHKTADKINDKPKAKKSIANWAKEKGMDPEGAVYAIATNMAKKK